MLTVLDYLRAHSSSLALWLYGVVTSGLLVLVGLKVIDPSLVPALTGFATALLGISAGTTGTAALRLAAQKRAKIL
jgi:hypothetical protein